MVGIFDPGTSRFITTDAAEIFTLTPGELAGATQGLWVLGGNDTVIGSADPEIINGNLGDDSIVGGAGNDTLFGGQDNDILLGGNGDDFLSGNKGNDTLVGDGEFENGNDFIVGGKGDDFLLGSNGNDTLSGDFGGDGLSGGPGADVFILRAETATDTDSKSADVLLDFNFEGEEGDVIGLTDGLSEGDLIIDLVALEPTLQGSVISIRSSGNVLGVVPGKTPQQIQGRFISI